MSRYKAYPEYKESGVIGLDRLPFDWSVKKVKHIFNIGRGRVISQEELIDDGEFPVYSSQTANDGCLGFISTFDFDCDQLTWTTDGANAGTIFLRGGKHNCTNVCGTLQPIKSTVLLKFFSYSLQYVAQFYKRPDTNGAKIMNGEMAEILVSFPSDIEQQKIANFLDHETAKIDTLIAKQQELIKLLKEKRQAVISHAVTKGLNPNAPMRDSGVEWLGEVPAHWDVVNVRNLIRAGVLEIQDGNHGELHPVAAEYVDDGIPFLMANNVQGGIVSLVDSKFITLERASALRIGFAMTGDLLLTHKGTVGEVALVPEMETPYWMLTPQVTYYRWKNKKYASKYFFMFFRSVYFQVQLSVIGSKQSTRAYVGLIAQGDLNLLVPPIEEQVSIYDHLESVVKDFDAAIFRAERSIQLSNERRTALISAAVTGKIDVRDWQPPSESAIAA